MSKVTPMSNQVHNSRAREARDEGDSVRPCDSPRCDQEGRHRAPCSRYELNRYRWFCLEHVRQYNAAWNYYQGMSDAEVEADVRRDTVWRRPSWPLGGYAGRRFHTERVSDPFGFFAESGPYAPRAAARTPASEAMIVLDLRPPVTTATVQARYKELVKRHHPDTNGGDKASEEKIKHINQAYATIMDSLSP